MTWKPLENCLNLPRERQAFKVREDVLFEALSVTTMTKIKYFSYGSNMSSRRLIDRAPSAKFLSIGKLFEHQLRFHKKGKDGSGKCNAQHTGNPGHYVFGVLFDISASEKVALDRKEGLGHGYEKKIVKVILENGDQIEATTYYATRIDSSLKPYHWYKEHVLSGAEENKLPFDYISKIESIESIPDPDRERHEKELAIYL